MLLLVDTIYACMLMPDECFMMLDPGQLLLAVAHDHDQQVMSSKTFNASVSMT